MAAPVRAVSVGGPRRGTSPPRVQGPTSGTRAIHAISAAATAKGATKRMDDEIPMALG